ncbi:MAG: fibro-slime domain-containing protein [Oscillospiraceae bacterium]|nr:fibro-slime domain-containing protein [Oscillospiraceae bacterium]
MRNTVLTYIDRFRHDRHQRLVLGSVLLILALTVAILVYWQLRLNGIAMTNETYCGYEEHTHTEECYETTLICDLEETEGHAHNETCYDEEGNLICEIEECESHTHGDECYETTLICELPEHTHTVECLIDLNADVEDATVWEATIPALTGDLRTDVVSIAHSQLGYTESNANYSLSEDGLTHYGYTRYGAWYGNPYGDWSSMFTAFCLYYAGITEDFTFNAGAYAWTIDLANHGYYLTADAYTPVAGDIVFIDTDLDGKADVSAIVVAMGEINQTITVIQGNYSDAVALVEYTLTDSSILGYANVTYTGADDIADTDDTENADDTDDEEVDLSEEPTTLTFEGTDYVVTVSYGEDAALPDGTELVAYEYAQDSETFLSRYEEASALYGWEDTDSDTYHGFRLFNIGLYYEGAEIEPAASVTVTVTYTGETDAASVSVTHFSDTNTETLDATLTESTDSQSVTFTSDTFSDFGIALASEEEEETKTLTASSGDTLEAVDVADVISSLDGRSFIITGNTRTRAMQATASGYGMASVVVADTDVSELTLWTFTSDGNGYYYISSGDSYLQMSARNSTDGTLSLVDSTEATAFNVYAYEKNSVTYMVISATVGGYTYYINKSGGDSSSNAFVAYYNSPENGGSNSQVLIYAISDPYDDYESVDEFYLWIRTCANDTQLTLVNTDETVITDAWTDGTYYYIPVSYFTTYISDFTFDEDSTITCPFMYAPDATKTLGSYNTWNSGCLFAAYVQIGDDWYIQVTDTTTGYSEPRSNVYYCPTYVYWLYVGSTIDTSKSGDSTAEQVEITITDYVGYGQNNILIPVSYFSDYIVMSELSTESLTSAGTETINGETYTKYTATDFWYKTTRYGSTTSQAYYVYYNNTWYLKVHDQSTGYYFPRKNIIWYTGNVGVYTTESSFYLWIYDSDLTKVAGYSEYDSNSGANFSSSGITDVISYTDPDSGETYYYIHVSYFESALSSLGYDSADISSRSLLYAPSATATLSDSASNITSCLFADYEEIYGQLYVRVTDTTNMSPHRVNVYFCPEYVYNIYVGTATSEKNSVEEVTIDDYIGLGERYVLIPVSHFDNFFDESSLDSSTLTEVNDDFTGYGLKLYKSPFQYAANWSNTSASDAYYAYYEGSWYLLVQYNCTSYSIPLRNKIWYTASITEGVVLNLSNGSGDYEFTHYGDYSLRYTVDLSDFADGTGSVTINLPSDSDLDTTFAVASNTTDTAYVELSSESAYDYKLVGWVNIATGEYYDVSGGSVTATIDLSDNNVFYADWIAETYDFVDDTSDTNIIETANTSSFITIQLFDFNELFDLYSESLVQIGLTSETWTDSEVFYSTPLLANDATALTEIGKSFIFFDTDAPDSTNSGKLELPLSRAKWNYWTGASVQTDTSIKNSAYTGLYDEEIISMLYSTTGSTLGSYYVGDANYLFTYDSTTGFYEYDASQNAAVYQQSDGRFYVYNAPQYYYSSSKTNGSIFLPFNSYNTDSSAYTYKNGEINYWFGVKIELDFYLPNDTGIGGNQINEKNMVFEFEGDDDVWVFVDDKLVLDLGGIHSALEGTIDFSTGKVTIVKADGTSTTTSFSTISAGTHTLTFYYMERGASASNMRITLNTIPEWQYESSTVGTMTATKVWADGDDTSDRPDSIDVGLFERVGVVDSDGTYTDTDGTKYTFTDGYHYDGNNVVDAYLSTSNGYTYVYIRVDIETLSSSNKWTYVWTLLDSEKSEYYQILELSTLTNYTTSSSSTQKTTYSTYWSVEGYDTLNGTVTIDTDNKVSWTGILDDDLKIVLTDGAQYGTADASGFPTTYIGYVIYVTDSGSIGTTKVDFSQAAEAVAGSSSTYTYGVTTDIPDSAIWTIVMTGKYATFKKDEETVYAPTFYLKASNGKYLAFRAVNALTTEYELVLVDDINEAVEFSYNTLGELNTEDSPGLRIIIESGGSYALVEGRASSIDVENVKIYTPTTTTIGSDYTITNTVLPSVTLKKVDATDTTKILENVEFVMYQKDDSGAIGYYLLSGSTVTWDPVKQTLTTDSDGTITYKYLPDGTYYLKETATIDGYNDLTDELWFTVSGGKVTAVGGSSTYIEIDTTDTNSLTIIVKNIPGVELPSTGSAMTPLGCAIVGGIISAIAVFTLMSLKRRRHN